MYSQMDIGQSPLFASSIIVAASWYFSVSIHADTSPAARNSHELVHESILLPN